MSRADVAYRVRIGRLHRLHRGAYAVGHLNLTDRSTFIAAVFAIGDDSALSHVPAAAIEGFMRWPGGDVDVTVPRDVRRRAGIRTRCVAVLPTADVTWRRGIRVTTPARTLLDVSRTRPREEARRAVNQALVQRRVTVAMLYRQAAGPPGARLRALLADASPTRSEFEDVALEFFIRHGTRPETNARVGGFEVDCLWRERRLVVELDSAEFHDNPIQRADDARKQTALEAAGYRVERLRWVEVTRHEAQTKRRICAGDTRAAG